MGWKEIPRWFKGLIICFIIFISFTLYFHIGLENAYKTSSAPNIDLDYGLQLLGVYYILIPIVFIISIILSIIQSKKRIIQFKPSYFILAIIIMILAGILLLSLKYFFPVTYETNVNACALQKNPVLVDRCYQRVSIKDKNIQFCDKISNELYIKSCYNEWYYRLAEINKDSSLCSKIEGTESIFDDSGKETIGKFVQGRCYYNVAKETNDKNLCQYIEVTTIKDECLKL